MTPRTWHIVTGEYPPDRGGVGDHTAVLAAALAHAGHDVHVWTGGSESGGERAPISSADGAKSATCDDLSADAAGVHVHRVAGAFDRAGLGRLSAALGRFAAPRTLLIQYAPQAFGRRGMNVGFCRWVRDRANVGDDVRVMFHEPFFPFGTGSFRRNVLAAVNHWMARILLSAASRVYVSIPAWEGMLRLWAPPSVSRMQWLPVGSTVPRVDDTAAVAAIRARLTGGSEGPVIGHFGTYGDGIAPLLVPALRRALAEVDGATALLLGDRGPAFADGLSGPDADLRHRLVAPGYLPAREVSLHLQACDVVMQPYPDGASSRRTTLMAPLANAVPTVTTTGALTEDVWATGPVPLAPTGDAEGLAHAALALVENPARRAEAGTAACAFYERHFSTDRAVAVLEAE